MVGSALLTIVSIALLGLAALGVLLFARADEPGGPPPGGAAPPACRLAVRCEAEHAALTGTRAEIEGPGRWGGSSGGNFVVGFEHPGTSIRWVLSDVPAPGPSHVIGLRYSNNRGQDGKTEMRTLTLIINGSKRTISLAPTHSWPAWTDLRVPNVTLTEGDNVVVLECTGTDTGRVNIDFLSVY